jgi:hypothetical protein
VHPGAVGGDAPDLLDAGRAGYADVAFQAKHGARHRQRRTGIAGRAFDHPPRAGRQPLEHVPHHAVLDAAARVHVFQLGHHIGVAEQAPEPDHRGVPDGVHHGFPDLPFHAFPSIKIALRKD